MTLQELITIFRGEVEDLVATLMNRFYFNNGVAYTDEGNAHVESGVAYADEAEVLALIPEGLRYEYLTVNIAGVEYWFTGSPLALTQKFSDLSIADGSVGLAKMADMATSSVIYRKTAGTGPPEVQTLATLKTDLGIIDSGDITAALATKVDKVVDYSLASNADIANFHAPGSDDQDLSGLVEKETGKSLIDDTEIARLLTMNPGGFELLLSASSDVATRISGGITVPSGWTLAAVGDLGNDLEITHTLTGTEIVSVTVKATDTGNRVLVPFRDAYSGILEVGNVITLEGLAKNDLPLIVILMFK